MADMDNSDSLEPDFESFVESLSEGLNDLDVSDDDFEDEVSLSLPDDPDGEVLDPEDDLSDEDDDFSDNPYGQELFPVRTPSGGKLRLMTKAESNWFRERADLYRNQFSFTNVSDLQDLDKLLMLEVMVQRWSTWLTQGFDYQYTRVDEHQLNKNIQEYTKEIRLLKQSIGMDKKTRDKDKEESVGAYIEKLLQRAKEFGVHRNEQYEKAVTLIYQLKSMVLMYDRCDEEERNNLDLSHESIMKWIREEMVEEWDAIDEAYRKVQTLWIREV